MKSSKYKALTLAIVVVLAVITVAACTPAVTPTPTQAPTSSPKPTLAPSPTTAAPAPTTSAPTTPAPSPKPSATAEIRTKSFTIASSYPPTSEYNTQILAVFAAKLSELSGGKMEGKIFAGSVLGKQEMGSQIVGTGRADIGNVIPTFEPGVFPLTEGLVTSPEFTGGQYKYWAPIYHAVIDKFPEVRAEWETKNLFNLMAMYNSGNPLWTKKPISTLEEAKGLLIRAAGGMIGERVASLGVTPVAISSTELYVALQKGTVDGAVIPANTFLSASLYEVAKYGLIIAPGFLMAGNPFAMNLDAWKGLNQTEQGIVLQAAKAAEQNYTKYRYATDAAEQTQLESKGVRFAKLSPENQAAALAKTKAILDKWMASKGAIAKQMFDYSQELLKKEPAY